MRQLSKAVLLGIMASALIALPATAGNGDDAAKDQAREQVQAQVQNNTCTNDCEATQTRTQDRDQIRTQDGSCDEACEGDMVQMQIRLQLQEEGNEGPLTIGHLYRYMASDSEAGYIHRVHEMCPNLFMPV